MINLGIAGMGYIGRVHLEASRKVPGVQVLAVATLQPERSSLSSATSCTASRSASRPASVRRKRHARSCR